MGIVVVTLPVMSNANQEGLNTTILQEAIFGASAELNQALSYRWDENSLDDVNDPNGIAKVVETGDCENNSSLITYRLRPGHIIQPLHRRCVDSNLSTPSLGANGGDLDDVDDISATPKPMFLNTGTSAGYKQDFNSTVSVTFATIGTVTAASKNAKRIDVNITDGTTQITRLNSYTLNIGEVDFFKKTY